MPSGTWTGTGSYVTSYVGTLTVTQISQDIATNKSVCRATLLLENNSYNYFRGYAVTGSISRDSSVVQSVAFDGYMVPNQSAQYHSLDMLQGLTPSGYVDFEVEHNLDGTKTIELSATITTGTAVISGTKVGAGQINITGGTLTLDTIPRASTLTAPSVQIGSSGTLTITRNSTAFYEDIAWECNGVTGGIIVNHQNVLSQNVSFNPPSSIYSTIPNDTSASITYTITTYTDSTKTTQIGENTTVSTVTVGSSIKPSTPLTGVVAYNTNAWLSSEGLSVAGFTQVSARATFSPGTGATRGDVLINIDGQTATVQNGETYTTPNPVNIVGAIPVVFTVFDSRGRSTQATNSSLTFLEYNAPAITSFKAIRGTYNGGWTSDPMGPHIRVKFNATVSLTNNTGDTVVIGCTNQASQTLNDVTSGTVYFDQTNATTEYTVTLSFTDKVGTTITRKVKVLSAAADFNFNTNLPALGLGRLATRAKMVESAWDMEVEKSSGEAYYSLKNNNGEAKLRMSSGGVSGIYNELLSKWVVYGDASGHTNIPDFVLPVVGNSTASFTLSTDSGTISYSSSSSATTVTVPTGTPTGWFAIVIRARATGNMTISCGGSDQMYVKGQTGLVTSYAVPGYTTVFIFRTSATRLALMIGG